MADYILNQAFSVKKKKKKPIAVSQSQRWHVQVEKQLNHLDGRAETSEWKMTINGVSK